ncbi:Proteinase inhibitor I3, Kunitz legume [Sesbania bispinosa]|nr:Proteinase inhibitor I3, Kunitz legume [Sesbania bispinosa]
MKATMILFLSSLLIFNMQLLLAAEVVEPVIDTQGEPLKPGVSYYVWPLWADKGGLTLGRTRNKTCPLDIIRDPSFIGSPMTFHASDNSEIDYIPTLTNLTVTIPILAPCKEPKVWKLTKVGSGFWFVSTGGIPGDLFRKFMIERLEGDHHYACNIYSFKFCPSVPNVLCAPVGTFIDSDGTKVMAVGDDIEPYYVRFHKVHDNQDFSIV